MARHPQGLRNTRPCAFTLLELVAASTAIALLTAGIAPSLEAARQKSKQSACLNRLRGIGAATVTYSAGDPNGHAIPVHTAQFLQDSLNPSFIGAYEWGGKSGIGRNTFVDAYTGTPHGSKYGTAAGFGPARRPLNAILYPEGFPDHGSALFPDDGMFDEAGALADTQLRLDRFRCPADNGPPRGAHCPDWLANKKRSSFDHFGTSYASNMFMVSATGGHWLSNSPYLRPVAGVPNPARTLSYEENIGRWAWAARRQIEDCIYVTGEGVDPGPTKAVRGWHGKNWMFNRSFVDAHAERQPVIFDGTQDREDYAIHYRNEVLSSYPPLSDCSQCQPLDKECPGADGSFEMYRCVIVRGPGWQKDTLPAPFICTGIQHTGPGRANFEDCVQSYSND